MQLRRTMSVKENLAAEENYSIDLIVKEDYTHSVQISLLPSGKVLQALPFDPTDRTVAGTISPATLDALGDLAGPALTRLSDVLLSQLGAKEFIVLPSGQNLPGFSAPETSSFGRFRHCSRESLAAKTAGILGSYEDLVTDLDKNYHFVLDEPSLMAGRDPVERYQEINDILEQARFTADKMAEYKKEELQGKISRFRSEYVRPIVMLDKKGKIAGMVRALLMGSDFAYLADEVINQDLVPLERFPGSSTEEQRVNREVFLLAYLKNKACNLGLADQRHLFIIAANGREKIYEQAGYENFPLKLLDWKAVLKFGPPGPALTRAQEKLKNLPLPSKPVITQSWNYGKYIASGVALLGMGLFAISRFAQANAAVIEAGVKLKSKL